ncbi:acyl-CoA thioesterase [Rhodovulum sulfidophilum]|uniref:acyl-CoA thioesterase n=1 Tax=Rhodovulum sulfidophilum TaxID=35806 RepID=UPI0005A69FFB|nr:acyl-CoA thioesterase [Rhodovulum sulfidophilum]ANB33399.1 thioeseterase [Rhodovulum sulfidophilum DSM 1374]ANB37220.1 thioeseterase [Rhodovulum sulfidophilum]MBK5925556.1 thioeseterase [Rhodovulum sulfidophilum]MBL3563974.1 acyl-CoA thioesterase [Rhodovulum sulfidophilum]MBL3573516.1 acyl-CoA thioesterase [Rhodovulum sulfidophilum]
MYPFFRLAKELYLHRKAEPLPLDGIHVSRHVCWPWDLDMWMELNNGRTLTLLDLGRLPLAQRVGLIGVLKRERWALTMAGVSVRYRRRVKMFDSFEIRSRCVGWDDKFLYIEQGMWRHGDCANHALYRAAVTDRNGIVPTARMMAAMGLAPETPPLPGWVQAWIAAEAERPWPPMTD